MEETNAMHQGTESETSTSGIAMMLTHFIENEAEPFMAILRAYVRKANLGSDSGGEQQNMALEVLNEVYTEALKTVTHFVVLIRFDGVFDVRGHCSVF